MTGMSKASDAHGTPGLVLNWGWRYDLVVSLLDVVLRGKLSQARQRTLDLARLQSGDTVLDVGCGTGTLALEAYERVGQLGRVVGIDPAPRQLARARSKAAARHARVDFQPGVIEELLFPDGSFDAVLSTWMFHHLPDTLKRDGLQEVAHVLKPGGRLLIADTLHHNHQKHKIHMGVGQLPLQEVTAFMQDLGLSQTETHEMPLTRLPLMPNVTFIRATKCVK